MTGGLGINAKGEGLCGDLGGARGGNCRPRGRGMNLFVFCLSYGSLDLMLSIWLNIIN